MKRLLLCTDLDRTLLPNGPQMEAPGSRDIFCQLARQQSVILVYVTGRDKKRVQDAIQEYSLPEPDYVIADVGSSIYEINDNRWLQLNSWLKEISADWNGNSAVQLAELLAGFKQLKLQEADRQNTYKLSYYVPLSVDYSSLVKKIKASFQANSILANIIWSIDELKATGLLDILPASANKRHAIKFLMQCLKFSYAETVFAGDSGNDVDVLSSEINAVLVANASDEVKNIAMHQAKKTNNLESLYIAQGIEPFNIMNGNYSAGILEGVLHYIPEMKGLMGLDQ